MVLKCLYILVFCATVIVAFWIWLFYCSAKCSAKEARAERSKKEKSREE